METTYLQFAPTYLDVDRNHETVNNLLADVETDLVVLPELFTSGYFFRSQQDLRQVAESIPEGPTTEKMRIWAGATGATVVAGLPEQDGNAVYNSALLVRPDGTTERYRKVHLFYEETTLFDRGNLGFPVFDVSTREGTRYRLGMMVCFDWYFPEAARSLALNGADVIAHPSNLVLPHCPDSMPVRARENHVFTVTANRYGSETKGEEELTFIGMSEVCDPDGEILRRADRTGDTVESVHIDPHAARNRHINRYNDVLGDRRPDAYVTKQRTEA